MTSRSASFKNFQPRLRWRGVIHLSFQALILFHQRVQRVYTTTKVLHLHSFYRRIVMNVGLQSHKTKALRNISKLKFDKHGVFISKPLTTRYFIQDEVLYIKIITLYFHFNIQSKIRLLKLLQGDVLFHSYNASNSRYIFGLNIPFFYRAY